VEVPGWPDWLGTFVSVGVVTSVVPFKCMLANEVVIMKSARAASTETKSHASRAKMRSERRNHMELSSSAGGRDQPTTHTIVASRHRVGRPGGS
jgi:hypothetical protein